MSVGYRAVGWNRSKRVYDLALLLGVVLYLAAFLAAMAAWHPQATLETALIRAFGSLALLLLHVILAIGPLCRLDRRFLPLLYNRRHLGVTMCVLALLHGAFALVQYHALGDRNPFVSLLSTGGDWSEPSQWPFQPFGFAALLILLLMAATSHDFWLANLTAPVWKALHMLVYPAYALLLAHVAFGVLQDETGAGLALLLGAGAAALLLLHLLAAARERRVDAAVPPPASGEAQARLLDVAAASALRDGRGIVVSAGGERVALFRIGERVAAVSSVCQHQNGPLGEGRVQDGCIVCPWHGYQYRPEDGRSPPPFTEAVPTFRLQLRGGRVLLDPRPCPAGTLQELARLPSEGAAPVHPATESGPATAPALHDEFFVGYLRSVPPGLARHVRRATLALLLLLPVTAALLVAAQGPFRPGRFEYGTVRSFHGVLREHPEPHLEVARGGAAPASVSRYLLVAPGKHGAAALCAGLDGTAVTLQGTLIYRGGQVMVELAARPQSALLPPGTDAVPGPSSGVEAVADVELVGQIVDSKCWFGVMNPADTLTHRACAERCLSGGVPALLRVQAEDGTELSLLLCGRDGRQLNRELLDRVAQPVRVRGALERQGELLLLRTEPRDVVLLPAR